MEIDDHEYNCKSGQHGWASESDAERCCNGWTYIMVPVMYGEFWKGKLNTEIRKDQKLWKPYLIKDTEVAEIERIVASSPDWILRGMQ